MQTGATFPRTLRLLRPAEFSSVFADSIRINGRQLTVLARANGLTHPRLGMAISRKNVRLAVERNRIKRQIRETFRLHQDTIGDFDIVVLGRAGIHQLDNQAIRKAITKCWLELASRRCDGS